MPFPPNPPSQRSSSFLGKMGNLDGFVGPCFRGRSRGRTDVPGSGPRRKSWWRNARKAGRSLREGGRGRRVSRLHPTPEKLLPHPPGAGGVSVFGVGLRRRFPEQRTPPTRGSPPP